MRYKNIDTIKMTLNDFKGLFRWKENNRNLVLNFRPVLEEGVIIVDGYIKQYFKQGESAIEIEIQIDEEKLAHILMVKVGGGQLEVLDAYVHPSIRMRSNKTANGIIEDAIGTHCCTMAYMEHFMSEKRYVDNKMITQSIGNTSKKSKGKRKKVKKIQYRLFNIRTVGNEQEVEYTREYERKAEGWTVRGHWRHYEDGKKVWIRPYAKGDSEKIEGTTYTF